MNLRQGSISIHEYSLKFNTLSKYVPMLVVNQWARMNIFILGVSYLINKKCHIALFIMDMDLTRFMTYAKQIEEKKLWKIRKNDTKRLMYDVSVSTNKGGDDN